MQFWGTYQGYRQSSHALNWQMKRTFYYPNADLNGQDSQSHRISPIEYMEDGKKIQPEGEEK